MYTVGGGIMNKKHLKMIEDGIQFNIDDARNTIYQIKSYLECIYELLLRIIDQLITLTTDTKTNHIDSVVKTVNQYVCEIDSIVSYVNYNSRKLLRDNDDTTTEIIFRLGGPHNKNNMIGNNFSIEIPLVGIFALEIEPFKYDFSEALS